MQEHWEKPVNIHVNYQQSMSDFKQTTTASLLSSDYGSIDSSDDLSLVELFRNVHVNERRIETEPNLGTRIFKPSSAIYWHTYDDASQLIMTNNINKDHNSIGFSIDDDPNKVNGDEHHIDPYLKNTIASTPIRRAVLFKDQTTNTPPMRRLDANLEKRIVTLLDNVIKERSIDIDDRRVDVVDAPSPIKFLSYKDSIRRKSTLISHCQAHIYEEVDYDSVRPRAPLHLPPALPPSRRQHRHYTDAELPLQSIAARLIAKIKKATRSSHQRAPTKARQHHHAPGRQHNLDDILATPITNRCKFRPDKQAFARIQKCSQPKTALKYRKLQYSKWRPFY